MCLVLQKNDLKDDPIRVHVEANIRQLEDSESIAIIDSEISESARNLNIINEPNQVVPPITEILIERSQCGVWIFNVFTFFYFLSFVYISAAVLYILIVDGFESKLSYFLIILVPFVCLLSILMHKPKDYKDFLRCLPAFLYYLSASINISHIYSICNIKNIAWGTRKKKNHESIRFQQFAYKKAIYVVAYFLINSIFGFMFER